MGLKAGWLAMFLFVWIIGAFLGSTYEMQNTSASTGMSYSTGTATFTKYSTTVTGAGTAWDNATMAGGNIKSNTDNVWYRIASVTNPTTIVLASKYVQTGGAGHNYTIIASPGWAGTGTGGYATSPLTKLQNLMQANAVNQKNTFLGDIGLVVSNGKVFMEAMWQAVTWDWAFMWNADGTRAYGMIYWIFFFPFVAMGVFSLILLAYGILTGNLTF